ncbi:hypothetical protein MNBD_GAMMA12-3262 [hydrothermal vent metagenome]|uniref:DUF4350 domain-containing protein n=1 Tax=hydrothermal vent metagenome TaxID=652676 RepID=A0A3B0YGN8_9ZZZZ
MVRKLVFLFIFTIFIAGLWVFIPEYFGGTNSRLKTKKVYVGYRGYAAQNNLLAAHRYLELLGEKVHSQYLLSGVLSRAGQYDFIMLSKHGRNLPRIQTIDLLAWVKKGGRLTIGPQVDNEKGRHNSLLKELNVIQSSSRDDAEGQFKFFGGARMLNINFKQAVRFIYKGARPSETISDSKGVLAIRIQYGDGSVILYGDFSIFSNARIASKDHAALLSDTTQFPKPATVWFIYGSGQASLLQLVWKYLWMFLLSLAAIFVVWIWRASHRFGPLLARTTLNRRSLLEHIHAVASLQWNNNGRENLLSASRRAMQQRIESRHPEWLQLSDVDFLSRLSQSSGLSEAVTDYAIKAKNIKSEYDFLTIIQSLNTIRNSL